MKRRASLVVLLLGAVLSLPPLAHASPPDPTWIPGFYDDNDYDDVILFITGAVTAVDSHVADPIGLVTVCVGLIAPSKSQFVSTRPLGSRSTRAPPSLFA
jgi:hypothetical protein